MDERGSDNVSDSTGSYTNNSGTAARVTVIFEGGPDWDAAIDVGGTTHAKYSKFQSGPNAITLSVLVGDGQSYTISASYGSVNTHLRKPLNI